MKAIKRIWLVCMILLLLITNTVPALAAGTVVVLSSEEVYIQDKVSLVPIKITNNPGIIAFKITCEYDSNLLEIVDIIPGNVISTGTLFHNLGIHANTVDVSWYDINDHNSDGVLFVIAVKPTDKLKSEKQTLIEMTVSQEDTFNSQFNDVILNSEPIAIKYTNSSNELTVNPEKTDISDLSNMQIVSTVKTELTDAGIKSIDDADETVLSNVNKDLQIISANTNTGFSTIDEMISAYQKALIGIYSEKLKSEYGEELSNRAAAVLNLNELISYDELSDNKKIVVILELLSDIEDSDETFLKSSIVETNDYSSTELESLSRATADENANSNKGNYLWLIIVCIAGALIVTFIIRKRIKQKS